jgi:hypothetical protein
MKNKTLFFVGFLLLAGCCSDPFNANYQKMSSEELASRSVGYHSLYFYSLNERVVRAQREEDCSAVQKLAPELLAQTASFKEDWNYGNALFDGNMALGYCAVKSGDLAKAEHHLEAACSTPGSPQLDSFGLPMKNLNLIKELLLAKRKAPALACFKNVSRFWNSPDAQKTLEKWRQDIDAGKIPDFKYAW